MDSSDKGLTYKRISGIILIGWAFFHLWFNTFGIISAISFRAVHCIFLLTSIFLILREKISVIGVILSVLTIGMFGYFLVSYSSVSSSGGRVNDIQLYVSFLMLILVFLAGWKASKNLTILAGIFLLYNIFGAWIPGYLGHNGFTIKRILITQVWGTQGIFGTGVGVSVSYIFLFVVLGAFLKYSGFSQLVNDISLGLVGASAGGPAKVAVLSSALLGMINGSAVANVATTGTITIPLMKKSGYRSEFAAAVEATASTGGQFCPPIMGAVGFIMAEFLDISYSKVMLAAAIPAFLYYLGILLSVHFEAKKMGLSGISRENLPNVWPILKERGHLLIPLVFLIVMILMGYTPLFAASLAILVTVLSSWIRKDTRMSLKSILDALIEGTRSSINVGVSCVLIGIIIGTVTLTSLGLNIGYMILNTSLNSNVYLIGFLVMIMSVILGMGVPGVAAYVIVQSVAAPILLKAGVNPISAHLFCLIYACLSNITPPVAISCYVASGIAESNQTKTGLLAVKIGLIGFVIPFFFLCNPVLLLGVSDVSILETLWTLLTASIGTIGLTSGLEGWLFKKESWVERILIIGFSFLLIYPGIITDIIGIIVLLGLIIYNMRKNK